MDDLEKKLENLSTPQISNITHQRQLKLSILNARKSGQVGIFMLAIPFSILFSALLETLFKVALPPWSWLKMYNPTFPVWLRVSIFVIIVIVLPLTALIINILSVVWFQYDRTQKVLQISIKFKTINTIIIVVSGLLAFLFIGHTIADWIAGN